MKTKYFLVSTIFNIIMCILCAVIGIFGQLDMRYIVLSIIWLICAFLNSYSYRVNKEIDRLHDFKRADEKSDVEV